METPQARLSAASTFTIGSVLSRAFTLLMKNAGVCIGLQFAVGVLSILFECLEWTGPGIPFAGIIGSLLEFILGFVVQGAITYVVYQTLKGGKASLGNAVSCGMARFVPLFLVALLYSLGVGLGTILLVIPGVILSCMWSVAVPACVVEKLGALDSLERSAELTKGYRMTIFWAMLVACLGLGIIIGFVFLFVIDEGFASDNPILGSILVAFIMVIPQAYFDVLMSIIYYDLRAVKEGVSVDNLVTVFD